MNFHLTVKNGKLNWKSHIQKDTFDRYIETLNDKKVVLNVDVEKKTRTLQQNAYLWGAIYPEIAGHTGHTPEELHEIYKRQFLPPRFLSYKDKEIKLPATTTKLSTLEMIEFIERVLAEASSLGIHVPTPEEAGYETEAKALQNLSTTRSSNYN